MLLLAWSSRWAANLRRAGDLLWRLLLAAIVASFASTLGPAGPASASASSSGSTTGVAQTRVGASPVASAVVVGMAERIGAGQHRGDGLPQAVEAVATGVAAKPAIGFAEGLGKSALTPNRLQHGTKNLTKAGVLPAWSGKNSPGIIERAFTPILEHPRATFDHSLGGTSVRGFLGDIDGTQVAVFVYKEGPYQGQLASSFVPSPNQLAIWGIG